ncbi:hypothetical protein E1A91_D08G098000v1 [Gossypium mustelinum]|uniref:ENTH domain-containing protein n=1 Tax=Gossypium mustelinum TaxID=34275 RepID=A0A5D2TVD3_GOSMU|nr:hypothetical protein E1A91_D08G098000v1 [Gossypium mustelinum]
MGTLNTLRKAYGVLKDKTKIGLAKFNNIAIVKATNHIESPPKERHVRKIFAATSVSRPQTDIAYCFQALAKRLSKTRSWIVATKILIVIHRTLREGDPTFRDELLNYAHRGNFLQISNFKDDSSHFAWVKTYAVFLEKRLDCFRVLQYDIEAERLTKLASGGSSRGQSRRMSSGELIEQLPALQQLLSRLIGCQPEGAASDVYLIQYPLALVLKESFKIYCAINDGIMNLIDVFFKMSQDDAVKTLGIYKRAGQQVEELAEFYEYCKGLELAKNFQFPALRQPPPSFLATMEEYVKEAPQSGTNLASHDLSEQWELALFTTPSNNTTHAVESELLLVDSVYEDEAIRRQKQLTNARYGSEGQPMMMTVPYQYPQQLQVQYMGHFNPFGEPPLFSIPPNSILLQ